MENSFMNLVRSAIESEQPNVSITENGAVGFETTGSKLVDINFALSSMRNMEPEEIWDKFLGAYNENPMLAMVWLFFARDVRNGCGERRTFRIIFERLCNENPDSAIKLLNLIPLYGRWDDVVEIAFGKVPCKVRDAAFELLSWRIKSDILSADTWGTISLLAKWLPSSNTSSAESRRRAEELRRTFGWTPKQYRKNLARLRERINVVEQKMSANEWDQINYEGVPSRAAMNYRKAFAKHDPIGYENYLTNVKEGKAKINSGVLFPHDIVHAYGGRYGARVDSTLEEQWKALPNKVAPGHDTLVVVDGSGSMGRSIGNTSIECHDVADALGIYFAERLTGAYRNSFITFSSHPQFISFAEGLSLRGKLNILKQHDDCSNTDIEKTFDLILDVAVSNHLKQEEIPANILIVSDMEFDALKNQGEWPHYHTMDQALFVAIRERWEAAGYKVPRLVFWNVCSSTKTIPVTMNEFGVALVSGFSPNIADMVMSGRTDPYDVLKDKLMSEVYNPVREALKE